MPTNRRLLSATYLTVGILMFSVSVWQIIRSAQGGSIIVRCVNLSRRFLGGTSNFEDLYSVKGFLLPLLTAILISALLIVFGVDLMRRKPKLPKIRFFWCFAFTALIILQLWAAIAFGTPDFVVISVLVAFIILMPTIQSKFMGGTTLKIAGEGTSAYRKSFFATLIIVAVLLVGNFLLSFYLAHQYPGQLIEFWKW